MSKNMFYIKEEDQELFDNFKEVFKDYAYNSVRYINRNTSYSEDFFNEFAVVFFVLFTRTRGDYYRNIINVIVDIYNGMERDEIEEKYKGSKYVLSHTIYVGKDHNSIFFKALDNFIDSIYNSNGSIFNIDIEKWEFPYLVFRTLIHSETNSYTVSELINDSIRNKKLIYKKPILEKIVVDFVSYFDYNYGLAKLNYLTRECTNTKLTISYLENQIKNEKEKLNKLESELARIKRNNPLDTETYISLLKSNREIGKFATVNLNQKVDNDTN